MSEKGEKLIKVRVLRDYWVAATEDNLEGRVRAGTIVDVPVEAAMDGVEGGMLERVKD